MSEAPVAAARSLARPLSLRGRMFAFALAGAVAVADLWSKAAVFASLSPGQRRWVSGDWLALTSVMNPGVIWGALPQARMVMPWLRAGAAIAVIVMLFGTHPRARTTLVALGLVLGGAVGNVYDGFVHGAVRDFVLVDLGFRFFDPFPIFNVADAAICVGVGLLALGMLFERTPRD